MDRSRWVWLALVVTVGCKNPDPTCAPGETPYRLCADDRISECPVGTEAQIAAKQQIESDCDRQPDPVQCLLDAEFELVPTRLVEDCDAAGQICLDDPSGQSNPACEDP